MNELIDLIIGIKVDIDKVSLLLMIDFQIMSYIGGFIAKINGDKGLGTSLIIASCIMTLFITLISLIKLKDTIIFMKGRKTK